MKFFISPFRTPDTFSILPALDLRVIKCGHADCGAVHGYELGLHWFDFGISAVLMFRNDDLT